MNTDTDNKATMNTKQTKQGVWDEKSQAFIKPSGTVKQGRRPMFRPFDNDDTCPKCGSAACSHGWELDTPNKAQHSRGATPYEVLADDYAELLTHADKLAESSEPQFKYEVGQIVSRFGTRGTIISRDVSAFGKPVYEISLIYMGNRETVSVWQDELKAI